VNACLFIIFLRRPRDKKDSRADPFWEFGSFGCTGCHSRNLLNPKRRHIKSGDRVAFVQGGRHECRLLLITPPVMRIDYCGGVELRWSDTDLPFRYSESAPLLADAEPDVPNTLPELARLVNPVHRTSAAAKLASLFRARCKPLCEAVASELSRAYDHARSVAPRNAIMPRNDYSATVPGIASGAIITDRRGRYERLRVELLGPDHSSIPKGGKGRGCG
jgi:hypothetical protein